MRETLSIQLQDVINSNAFTWLDNESYGALLKLYFFQEALGQLSDNDTFLAGISGTGKRWEHVKKRLARYICYREDEPIIDVNIYA